MGRIFLPWVAVLLLVCSPLVAQEQAAQPRRDLDPKEPIATVVFSGADALLKDMDMVFAAAERPEFAQLLRGLLALAGDLQGLDRGKPFGVMVYLDGIVPQLVGFLPVSDIDQLLKSATFVRSQVKKTGENEYVITGPQTLYLVVRHGHALFSTDPNVLKRELPDPAGIVMKLAGQYDVAATVHFKILPELTKEVLADYLRADAELRMERREGEDGAAYRLRRAIGKQQLHIFERMIEDGDALTVGVKLANGEKRLVADISLTARADSELDRDLKGLAGQPSRFSRVPVKDATLSVLSSWNVNPLLKELAAALLGTAGDKLKQGPLAPLLARLEATAAAGKLDGVFQLQGSEPGTFTAVAGLLVAKDAQFPEELAGIVRGAEASSHVAQIKLKVATHRKLEIHSIQLAEGANKYTYGENARILTAAGPDVLWIAVGGEEALPALKRAIDRAAEPAGEDGASALRIRARLKPLAQISFRGKPESALERTAVQAVAAGSDEVRIDVTRIESGARLRVEFDEALLRFVGLYAASQVDRRLRGE